MVVITIKKLFKKKNRKKTFQNVAFSKMILCLLSKIDNDIIYHTAYTRKLFVLTVRFFLSK